MGDPVGIGPEITLKALKDPRLKKLSIGLIVLGDLGVLKREAKRLKFRLRFNRLGQAEDKTFKDQVNVLDLSDLNTGTLRYGKPSNLTAKASLTYIDHAVRLAKERRLDAIVTGPVNKHSIFKVFKGFKGHTEYIARHTNSRFPVMLMISPKMKVIPLTTHEALSKVPSMISTELIVRTLRTADLSLKDMFKVRRPRIGVAGLNPHSGEEIFGTEESDTIYPAVKISRSLRIDACGPLPPDSIFLKALKGEFDLVLAMYHDQGLIPIKTVSGRRLVNMTLGIPIIRTSVGHGVAYDIAGKMVADHESMVMAIRMTAKLVRNRKEGSG